MRINVYTSDSTSPVRLRKWVRNILDAQSFCDWYKRTHNKEVSFVICR